MGPVNYLALSALDISSDQASSPISGLMLYFVSAQAAVTGSTPIGTFKLQASNDLISPTSWSDIGTPIAVSATGVYLIPALQCCYAWVRVAWVKSSGSGAITVNVKGFGI